MGSVVALHSQLRGEFPVANDAETTGVELWLSAQEIADARLPGIPKNKRKVNELAGRERWAFRVAADGTSLARTRKGRGGGVEYHVDLLPPSARTKLVSTIEPACFPQMRDNNTCLSIWSWFDEQKQVTKDEAANRLSIILEVERLSDSGMTVTGAIAGVASRFGIGIATINNWRSPLKGIARADWLPHLAARRVGGGKTAEVDAEIWRALVSQYLLPSKQPFKACYADATRRADAQGIAIPQYITLKRKLEREIDPLVIIKCREGKEALERAVPSLIRDVSHMHAMQKVNIDGHLWDVRVRWPDGSIARPMMVAIQDIYSRKMLAWNIDRSENSGSVRKAFEKLLRTYGVPQICLCDNGRAFASKWISGGTATRNRYEIRADDPLGLLPALGIKVEWAQPYHGQSKPIERSFGYFCNRISKCPEFSGAYVGRSPLHKPHDYGARAIDLADFIAVLDRRIAELNAEEGRKTQMAAGKRSVDAVFAESYAVSPIGKATPEALALALMDAKKAKTHRHDGSVMVAGNRYWSIELSRIPGEDVIVRYNPDNLKDDVRIYRLTGELITVAPVWAAVGFDDIAGASAIKKLRKDVSKATKQQVEALDRLDAAELAEIAKQYAAEAELPEPTVIRPVRHRGNTVAAIHHELGQPAPAIASGDAALKLVSERDESALKAKSKVSSIDRIAAALERQRLDED